LRVVFVDFSSRTADVHVLTSQAKSVKNVVLVNDRVWSRKSLEKELLRAPYGVVTLSPPQYIQHIALLTSSDSNLRISEVMVLGRG